MLEARGLGEAQDAERALPDGLGADEDEDAGTAVDLGDEGADENSDESVAPPTEEELI